MGFIAIELNSASIHKPRKYLVKLFVTQSLNTFSTQISNQILCYVAFGLDVATCIKQCLFGSQKAACPTWYCSVVVIYGSVLCHRSPTWFFLKLQRLPYRRLTNSQRLAQPLQRSKRKDDFSVCSFHFYYYISALFSTLKTAQRQMIIINLPFFWSKFSTKKNWKNFATSQKANWKWEYYIR